MAKKNKKVLYPYRGFNINVGVIIFAIIFLYLTFSVTAYFGREKIQFYEVAEGGIVNDKTYTGLILREEQVRNTENTGYINYYLREGKRASVGTRIYSIDETGRLKSLLEEENTEQGTNISDENLSDLKRQLNSFVLSFDCADFSQIYDSRYSLESQVMEYASFDALDQLDRLASQAGVTFQQVSSDVSGVVSYGFDSYESLTPEEVEASSFDRTNYAKEIHQSGTMVEAGTPAYKIVTSENWCMVFQMTEDEVEKYRDKTSLTVRFSDGPLETKADFSIYTGKDGASYGRLDFSKYMEQFIGDRFVDFEIVETQTQGLKIPITAVTEKSFYLIPKEYMSKGGDSSGSGFYKEVLTDSGTSAQFCPVTVYYEDEDYYYVDMLDRTASPSEAEAMRYKDKGEDGFRSGDYLIKPETSERYRVGAIGTIKGAYNINKGYTVFKYVDIIDSNNEYYTIAKGSSYGLTVYDHIVLDASLVNDNEILY